MRCASQSAVALSLAGSQSFSPTLFTSLNVCCVQVYSSWQHDRIITMKYIDVLTFDRYWRVRGIYFLLKRKKVTRTKLKTINLSVERWRIDNTIFQWPIKKQIWRDVNKQFSRRSSYFEIIIMHNLCCVRTHQLYSTKISTKSLNTCSNSTFTGTRVFVRSNYDFNDLYRRLMLAIEWFGYCTRCFLLNEGVSGVDAIERKVVISPEPQMKNGRIKTDHDLCDGIRIIGCRSAVNRSRNEPYLATTASLIIISSTEHCLESKKKKKKTIRTTTKTRQ